MLEIAPGCTCAEYPQACTQHRSVISRRATVPVRCGGRSGLRRAHCAPGNSGLLHSSFYTSELQTRGANFSDFAACMAGARVSG